MLAGISDSGGRMKFTLAPLPFAEDALEPHISQRTVNIHYHKHHKGYLSKLDKALVNDHRRTMTLEGIIRSADGPVFNSAAQVWNHSFYWQSIKPGGNKKPGTGPFFEQVIADFGSFDALQKQLGAVAAGEFGSGWGWLVYDDVTTSLQVISTTDAENPLLSACTPLLTVDVWEHAYYLDYQNEREKYLDAAIKHLINWDFAAQNFQQCGSREQSRNLQLRM
jgi:Fe-Mn family superoxide dismutase